MHSTLQAIFYLPSTLSLLSIPAHWHHHERFLSRRCEHTWMSKSASKLINSPSALSNFSPFPEPSSNRSSPRLTKSASFPYLWCSFFPFCPFSHTPFLKRLHPPTPLPCGHILEGVHITCLPHVSTKLQKYCGRKIHTRVTKSSIKPKPVSYPDVVDAFEPSRRSTQTPATSEDREHCLRYWCSSRHPRTFVSFFYHMLLIELRNSWRNRFKPASLRL